MLKKLICLAIVMSSVGRMSFAQSEPVRVTVHVDEPGKPMSSNLMGIFFEDINYAADGGLYAEMVQNRSFEYSEKDNRRWNSLTGWDIVRSGRGDGAVVVATNAPVHPNNPHYAVLSVTVPGAGIRNAGFDGISVTAGETYRFSVFARETSGTPGSLRVRLEGESGEFLGEALLPKPGNEWKKLSTRIRAAGSDAKARLVLIPSGTGSIALDMVSLFPHRTFRNRPNGLRADLAQVIADLKPRFVRFPGGCLVHGDGLENMYRWKDTIGPVEERKTQRNIWNYHQSVGLGYFEYFQFCEDIGAKPLPVVPAGVCCQNSGASVTGRWGQGQQGLPMDEMPDYVQEVLDLIEYANGPVQSKWGSKRAAAGHPKPFKLEYLGVGNEDRITPEFTERFLMIQKAVKAKHPEITVIGTVGPFHSGEDFEKGWAIAREHRLEMVDEHYYEKPAWFLNNLNRYDSYDRAGTRVYLGEYAAHDTGRLATLRSALAEAAYLTHVERNSDIVLMASYAPLLGKIGHTQWNPNLIYFDNTRIVPTINYHVQQLFGVNSGEVYLVNQVEVAASVADAGATTKAGVFLGTWNSQAEYDDVEISGAMTLKDRFADASDWQAESGSWSVADGVYRQTSNQEPALSRWTGVSGSGSYELTLRARKTAGAEGFLIGFGAADKDNYYWWNLGGWGNSRHAVEKATGGERQVIGSAVPGRIEPGRWYAVRVRVSGERIQCYLDGQLVHEIRDPGFRLPEVLAFSSIRDTRTGDVVLKVVNVAGAARKINLQLDTAKRVSSTAEKTLLTGDPMAVNRFDSQTTLQPSVSRMPVGKNFSYEAPAHSLTVIRIKTK